MCENDDRLWAFFVTLFCMHGVEQRGLIRVASDLENIWNLKFFQGQGKVWEISVFIRVRETSGAFVIVGREKDFGYVGLQIVLPQLNK